MTIKRQHDKIDWKRVYNPRYFLQILIGVCLAVLAMKGFMIPNLFMDGGITGISIGLTGVRTSTYVSGICRKHRASVVQ